ncbi:transmembrane protein-like [Tropilaelaps mercedesae]|uniref:Transmembrane protein-like n=1 Tax=Tropilaelaps mercedesae TaxID=418985 RepID=A0A1V9XLD1_9ACAR|nr:transmembrane protein-like [Tropilaelaps mercedesae]
MFLTIADDYQIRGHPMMTRCALVFSCAVGGSLGLRLLSSMGRIMSQVRKGNALTTTLGRVFYPKGMSVAVDLGLALATFSAAFNGISCYLRRTEKRDAPWYAIPSSVVASFAAYWLWPSQRITIYALCNTLYDFYMMGVAKQMVPTIPHGPNLAFASICAVIFSVGGIKPHYIRKSYVSFINRILGNRVDRINWSAISHAGFDSARVYKENLPAILNPDYVSTRYMQTMWVWSLADYMYKIHKRPVV